MWMGGNVPLGYDASERTLVIDPTEAETVRRIFAVYLELGCVRRVKDAADRLGLTTKRSATVQGAERGGKPFSRGHLYRLLSNPIYIGQIAHKGELYPGQHPPLIDAETWNAVRDQLAVNRNRHRSRSTAAEPSLLAGLVTDARGERLTPSHAVKSGRRYRYYVSAPPISQSRGDRTPGLRLAATELEDAVIRILFDALANPAKLLERLGATDRPPEPGKKIAWSRQASCGDARWLARGASEGGTRACREGHHRCGHDHHQDAPRPAIGRRIIRLGNPD
jgi:site-specific DNA recombinase